MRAALLVLVLTTAPALAGGIPAKPGQSYLAARQQMLADGYAPGPTKRYARGCGIGWEDICQGHPETYDCQGTGAAGCRFVLWKDDQPVLIQTRGEEIADQKVARVKVLSVAEQKKLFAAP